ncbi:hypothetical protein AGMMS50225_15400 [Betaproteobacteria bacterium]|nr:hypothetical protein AGMMS50225_15400 [Betaproteobacteria bacterium]
MSHAVSGLRDFFAGGLFCCAGVATLAGASQHPLGTSMRMGAGYFPLLLGALLFIVGAIVLARVLLSHRRLRRNGESSVFVRPGASGHFGSRRAAGQLARQVLLPAALVGVGVLAFAGLLHSIGLVGAIVVLVTISGAAHHEADWRELLPLGAGLAVFGAGVFVWGLGLSLPVLPA